jgi:(R,R)-butanediol dehydrogenase/meso-butanediol dehydrogenase/diacetyl reductase
VKAALLKGPREIVLEDIPVPEITDDDVLVEVKWCGICGSDTASYRKTELIQPGTYLGHEFSGVLAKVGKHVKGWKVGDRVVCNELYECGECYACKHAFHSACRHCLEEEIGCRPGLENAGAFARYTRVRHPEYRLYRIPDGVSFEEAALTEPLAVSLHAVRMSLFKPRDRVMVLGLGMIGLGAIAHLKNSGAGLIITTYGRNKKRAELALKMGADHVFSYYETPDLKERVLELTDGEGVDVVFECSGIPDAFQSATSFLRPRGQLLLVGIMTHEVPLIPAAFVLGEYNLQGSFCYYHDEFPMVLEFLSRKVLPVNELITSKIELSNIVEEGFEVLTTPGNAEVKIIVQPD